MRRFPIGIVLAAASVYVAHASVFTPGSTYTAIEAKGARDDADFALRVSGHLKAALARRRQP